MNRKLYSVIIVSYTILNIIALVSFNINSSLESKEINNIYKESEAYNDVKNSLNEQEDHKDNNILEEKSDDIQVKDEGVSNKAMEEQRVKANREREYRLSKTYENDSQIAKVDEADFDKYNKEIKEKNKVMKVPADELINKLTISEKAKIMGICKELDENDYSEITEFLTYKNERLAVMRTLNVIENKVDEEEVEELKKIFSKYIDMKKVEGN